MGGLSDARNAALDVALGEYFAFVDSDDYIENDMLETLYKNIVEYKADISMCSFYFTSDKRTYSLYDDKKICTYNKEETLRELLIDKRVQSYAWDKLYKRSLFDDVRYPVGKKYEDIGTTFYLFDKIEKLVVQNTPKYYYLQRDDSIVAVKNESNINGFLDMAYLRYNYMLEKHPELKYVNIYCMVDAICMNIEKICVSGNLELFKNDKIREKYELLKELVSEYEKDILSFMDNYQKTRMYMLLFDIKLYEKVGLEICKTQAEKEEKLINKKYLK